VPAFGPAKENNMTTQTAVRSLAIDRSHSEVDFQVRHLLSKVRGRFNEFGGSIEFDQDQPERSRVDVTIQAGSIDTAEPDRDKHLRSGDFFDVDKYPTLTFVSTSVTPRGENRYDVAGDLTIHGVTQQIVLPATFLGAATDPWGNAKSVFEADLTLNRKDFGLSWNAALETGGFLVGDEVKVTLSIQAK
jgi:polyisoprenoid-binding protein YceI